MRVVRVAVLFVFCVGAGLFSTVPPASAQAALPSFPGAEGFGTTTPGGRGGQVLVVTNTNDAGPGSLRAAIKTPGPRIIVFETGGLIDLESQLTVSDPFLTIAGQTAPGDGIAIRGYRLSIQANDVIVRGLRVRVGDGPGAVPDSRDGIAIGKRGGAIVSRVVIDHCSVSWATDENIATWHPVQDITFSNNLISEALLFAGHTKGKHSMGLLIGDDANRITVTKNLFAQNEARNPLVKTDTSQVEIISNYVYAHGTEATSIQANTTNHILNNFYVAGPRSLNRPPVYLRPGSETWLSGNLGYFRQSPAQPETDIAHGSSAGIGQVSSSPLFTPSGVAQLSAPSVPGFVVDNAGARWPQLDATDTRVIASVVAETGDFINSPDDVGGFPGYAAGTAAIDSDGDGMPDWFEDRFGFDNTVADHNGDSDGDGYTNIEEYINGIISGFDLPVVPSVVTLDPTDDAFVRDGTTRNYGNDGSLRIKRSSSTQYNRSAFLKFDISDLADVESATLRLAVVRLRGDVDAEPIDQAITVVPSSAWNEATIHGGSQPSASSQVEVTWTVNEDDLGRFFELDVSEAVSEAVAAGQSSLSLQVRGITPQAGARDIQYASSENSITSKRPTLEVSSVSPDLS